MLALTWATALIRRRPSRIIVPAAGVALAVALLCSLGAFLTSAKAQMTQRAIAQVPVDWQVEVQPGADVADIIAALHNRPEVTKVATVNFGSVKGFQATTGGTTQTTGAGVVVGLPPEYAETFPAEMRTLAGRPVGVLLAQQTAANLHAGPGDVVSIESGGVNATEVRVDGIVDLPAADSLFQHVGGVSGAQPQAPPDNVVLLPSAQWDTLFRPNAQQADIARTQVHVRLTHRLPSDPAAAFTRATSTAHRFEADVSGAALVGNNLAATLDAARSDALYAEVLFLLLGLPGAFLAALLTRAVTAATSEARRHDFALLRTRGASHVQLQRIAAAESAAVALCGAVAGVIVAGVVGREVFGSSTFGATRSSAVAWAAASVATGLVVSIITVAVPARRLASSPSLAAARNSLSRPTMPVLFRYGVDLILLGAGAVLVWLIRRGQYNLVLAPEGVPSVSVDYLALAGPIVLWIATALVSWRLVDLLLGRSRRVVGALVRPTAGRLKGMVASTVRRQRRSLATGVVLLALAVAFAVSTAVFNATYRHQVKVDALLTNGAAVTVSEAPGVGADVGESRKLAAVPGVAHVEPLQHRFVYVGADLQDLYGIDPTSIGAGGRLQDAYFGSGRAADLMARLERQPDSALVSVETARDFHLQLGDHLGLRVRDPRSGRLFDVPFRYAGTVKEFPTAPSDSFVVANGDYVARQTGDRSITTFLISTHRASPRVVARRLRDRLGTDAQVTDIDEARRVVGSSLTAVDLAGLTRFELAYALLLVIGATGLVFGLALSQRRRSFAIIAALGAQRPQLAAFARSEAVVFVMLGGALGAVAGTGLSHVLVQVLTGVFDPPPASLAVPWRYLATVGVCGVVAVGATLTLQLRSMRRGVISVLRSL